MNGHLQIIAARHAGQKPTAIVFELGSPPSAPTPSTRHAETMKLHTALYEPEFALETGQFPEVWITAEEVKAGADLRFVLQCRVMVFGRVWTQELIALGHALEDASAEFVAVSATEDGDEMMIFEHGEWRTT